MAAEAAWLRAFVETGQPPQPGDLYTDLNTMMRRHTRAGLNVELNATALTTDPPLRTALPPDTREALVGAANEALTNVLKHSGVTEAFLQVRPSPTGIILTVVDRGTGFDPKRKNCGLGLTRSIHSRIADIGGTVHIDSAPGSGTCVELTVPTPVIDTVR